MRNRHLFLFMTVLLAASLAAGCSRPLTKAETDQFDAIAAKIAKAEKMDVKTCAPRELAIEKAELDGARHEASVLGGRPGIYRQGGQGSRHPPRQDDPVLGGEAGEGRTATATAATTTATAGAVRKTGGGRLSAPERRFLVLDAGSLSGRHDQLRSVTSDNFVIIDETNAPEVIGEVAFSAALTTVHPKAIYIHGGQHYHVERLEFEQRKAYVKQVNVDYFTDAIRYTQIRTLEVAGEKRTAGPTIRGHGDVLVRSQTVRSLSDLFTTIAVTLRREDIPRARIDEQPETSARPRPSTRTAS